MSRYVFDDEPEQPVRYMEEPNEVEKVLGKIRLPKFMDDLRGSAMYRWARGMADPVVGTAQLAANVLPDETGIPQAVNERVAEVDRETDAASARRGNEGMDIARIAGNVTSPVNALIAARLPAAATAGVRAAQGFMVGAGTGAMQPVDDAQNGFWGPKTGQVISGGVTGGVLSPALGAVADRAIRSVNSARNAANASPALADLEINRALAEFGQTIHDIPPAQVAALRAQVLGALKEGKKLDAAALTRKTDFAALDMQPTLGQITRDPMQFAREQNLRGIEGVGEPISARLQTQGNRLQEIMAKRAAGARPSFQAGEQIAESLSNTDETLRRHVSGLYGEARKSAGKDLDIPLQGFAQDYADIAHRYGDRLPSGIRNMLNDYGLAGGTQTKVFTFEEADKVLKQINSLRSSEPATNAALGELRGALRRTIESVDASGGPFARPVKAAAERFKLHDAVPALEAAAKGSVAPDDFVNRFIVNGKTNEVKGLADVLKQSDPQAYAEARAQIGDVLKRAAFGENGAGDSPFAPARYMATVRRLGPDKLAAFFSPEEVAEIMRVGRVGSYIKSSPNAAAVSSSNSQVGLINVLARIPGVGTPVRAAQSAVGAVQRQGAASRAMSAQVPATPRPLNPEEVNILRYLMGIGAAGGGGFAGGAVGQ